MAKPYYEQDGITIYHGDCREVLPLLGRFDMLLTDPPYGLGIAANPVRQAHAKSSWDDAPVSSETLSLCINAADKQVIWGGNYFGLPASKSFFVCDKCQPEGLTLAMCEQAWSNINRPAKMFRLSVTSYKKEHPTQKPEELMAWCIGQCAPVRTVLDPFMGSGTTLVAAKRLGKIAVGIEREEKYCEIAAKRLSQGALPLEFST